MSWVAVAIVTTVSAGTTLYAADQQSKAIEENAELQSAIGEINAQNAELDALEAIRDGKSDQIRYESIAAKEMASMDAAFAANDIDGTTGAGADLKKESALAALLNGLDIENKAIERASQFKREADNQRTGAAISRYEGSVNSRNTMISGYASVANQAASATGSYARSKDK